MSRRSKLLSAKKPGARLDGTGTNLSCRRGTLALWATILCLLVLFLVAAPRSPAADATNPSGQSPAMHDDTAHSAEPNSVRFYTFIDNDDLGQGSVSRLTGVRMPAGARPMLQWFFWANQPKPFLRSALIILLFSVVIWSLMPVRLGACEPPVRKKFWSNLFVGGLITIVAVTLARASIQALIGWPLGISLLALLEVGLMAGLSLVVSVLGRSCAYFLRLTAWPVVGKHEGARRFAELLLGAVVCGALLQIPPIGIIPRIGTRVVALLAVLGLGALYRGCTYAVAKDAS